MPSGAEISDMDVVYDICLVTGDVSGKIALVQMVFNFRKRVFGKAARFIGVRIEDDFTVDIRDPFFYFDQQIADTVRIQLHSITPFRGDYTTHDRRGATGTQDDIGLTEVMGWQ